MPKRIIQERLPGHSKSAKIEKSLQKEIYQEGKPGHFQMIFPHYGISCKPIV
jgi:hypothetical protein